MTPPDAIRPVDHDDVASRLVQVRDAIAAAGGDAERITVLAVTKGFGVDAVQVALDLGLTSVGESYAQELADKATQVGAGPEWHFIGRLQSNKVRSVADIVSCWQSVDRRSLVDEIAKRAPGARVLVQVNASGEPQKGGCVPADVRGLVDHATGLGLDVEGLMTIGVVGDAAATERAFRQVAGMADALELEVRSMGMSGDLAAAVQAGSTMIRVGSALFGPRPAA